jgi:hypothetical protein
MSDVGQRDDDAAVGGEGGVDRRGQHLVGVGEVLQHVGGDDRVEALAGEHRRPGRIGEVDVVRSIQAIACRGDRVACRIESHDPSPGADRLAEGTRAAPQIEHRAGGGREQGGDVGARGGVGVQTRHRVCLPRAGRAHR